MKTNYSAKPRPARGPKLPRGRVMYASLDCVNPLAGMRRDKNRFYEQPVAVIPCATRAQARAVVRLHSMSREKLIRDLREAICEGLLGKGGIPAMGSVHTYDATASSALDALGLGGGK